MIVDQILELSQEEHIPVFGFAPPPQRRASRQATGQNNFSLAPKV